MAIQVEEQIIADNQDTPLKSYYVYDDAGAAVTVAQAEAEVAAVAPATVNGHVFGPFQRIPRNDFHVDIIVPYSSRQLRPLSLPSAGSVQDRLNFRAQPRTLFHGTLVSKEPSDAPDLANTLGVRKIGNEYVQVGQPWNPPPINRQKSYVMTNAEVSTTYLSTLEGMTENGTVNSASIFGRPAGSVMLVSATLQRRTDDSLVLDLGFAYKANVTSEPHGSLTVDHDGFDEVAAYSRRKTVTIGGRKTVIPDVLFVNVVRVHPRGDLNLLLPQ